MITKQTLVNLQNYLNKNNFLNLFLCFSEYYLFKIIFTKYSSAFSPSLSSQRGESQRQEMLSHKLEHVNERESGRDGCNRGPPLLFPPLLFISLSIKPPVFPHPSTPKFLPTVLQARSAQYTYFTGPSNDLCH